MKTTTNINRKDIIAIIAVIILFALMMPLNAANGKNFRQTASVQLAMFNNEIEKAVEFTAPVLSESFEVMAAETRLEELFGSVARDAAYSSPIADDNFETITAIENLDILSAEIEQDVKYTASPIAE